MLGVDLRKAKDLAVGELSSQFLFYTFEIGNLLGRERQALLLVIGIEVVDIGYGGRLNGYVEEVLSEPVVATLEHGVDRRVFALDGKVLFYATNALNIHVLRDFNGVRTPRGDHLATWSHEPALYLTVRKESGIAKKPLERLLLSGVERVIGRYGNDALGLGDSEKMYHDKAYGGKGCARLRQSVEKDRRRGVIQARKTD